MSEWSPDEAWLDARFEQRVRPDVFRGARTEARPVAVLLGAQPGAGKTRAGQFARRLYERRLAAITGDDFRALHPDYKRLQREDPLQMPTVTQEVSGPLVKRSVEFARALRTSVLVEGTFRDADMVLDTARAFHEAGFEVHVVALAVPAELSRASALGRYFETLGTDQNRWTSMEAHDAAVAALPTTVEMLAGSPAVDRFTILDRDGAVVEGSAEPGPSRAQQMAEQIRRSLTRPLTDAEARTVSSTMGQVARAARREGTQQLHPARQAAGVEAARLAQLSFAQRATEATRTSRDTPRTGPQRPTPGAISDRAPGIGE